MAKVPKVRTALDELREYADSLAPQRGFFSTLDQLIQEAPFDRAPADQWRAYLQPGRMLKRDEAQFPLKKEELEYVLPELERWGPQIIERKNLLRFARQRRPRFGLDASTSSPEQHRRIVLEGLPEWDTTRGERTRYMPAPEWGPEQGFPRLSHQSPGSTYEESVTRLENLSHPSHFTPDTLSWSRTSSHALPSGERMRLVEEIQSDLHQQAAKKLWKFDHQYQRREALEGAGLWDQYLALEQQARAINEERIRIDPWGGNEDETERGLEIGRKRQELDRQETVVRNQMQDLVDQAKKMNPRRGYRNDERLKDIIRQYGRDPDASVADAQLRADTPTDVMREFENDSSVPDAPFKNPADYGRLELRKQLLNAVNNDEDYLALTPGEVHVQRYSQDEEGSAEGTRHVYDKVYRGELEKLARQYGAEVVEVPLAVRTEADIRPEIMRRRNAEDAGDFVTIALGRESAVDDLQELIDELNVTGQSVYAEEAIDSLNDLEDYIEERETTGVTNDREFEEIQEELTVALSNLWDEFEESYRDVHQQVKTFPAIKLTPEVKERVKRIGVPLWSLVGGAAVLEPLLGEEEPAQYAKGGRIRKKLDLNKRLLHQTDRTYLDSIREKGLLATPDEILLPDERPGVNLIYGNSMDDLYFGPLKNWEAVVEVDPTKLDPRKITFEDIDWLRYLGDIPPEALIEAWGPNTAPLWRKRKKFQEGGMVLPPGTTLEDLENFGGWNPMEDLKRIAYGLGTQVIPYDVKTGQPSPGRGKPYRERESFLSPNWIYYDSLGREIWEDEYHRLRKLPPREVSVGIVDETLALPQLGSTVINAIAGKDVVGTPEFAQRASENVEQMNDVFRENLNVPYSDSLKDLGLESLGIMLGQLPVAGFGLAKSAGSGVGAAAKKIFGSPLEWFAPMIDPTVANYAVGTGAGALIQKYLPEYIESRDPNYRMASAIEAWEAAETDEERAQIEALPEFQQAIELMRQWEAEEEEARRAEIGMEPFADPDEDGENEFQSFFSEDGIIEDTGFAKGGYVAKKAKGGRIKGNRVPRKFTATFDDREGFVIQGVGDSPEEAVGKIRAELERLGENAEGLMREHGVEVRQETLHAKGGKVVQGLKDSDLEWRLRDRYSQIQERLLGKHDWVLGKLSDPDPSLTAEDIARLRAERDRLVNLINRLQEQPDEYAKGGKVKGPSLLELREQLKQMNLDAEGPNVEGTGRELVPSTGGMLDPVQSGTPTLEQIEQLARQPERPTGTVTRRDFLEGAAALMSPLPDPTSLIAPNPLEGAPLLDPATNAAKAVPVAALNPAQIAAKLNEAWNWIWETSEDPEFEMAMQELEGIPGAEDLLRRMREFDPENFDEEPWDELAQEFENLATKHRIIRTDPDATDEPMVFLPVEPYERSTEDIIYGYVSGDKAEELFADPEKFAKFEKYLREYLEVAAKGPEGWEELTPKQEARMNEVVDRLEELGFDIDSFGSDIG